MGTENSSFFYDGQIRRFLSQFIRMVSNIEVEFGKDRNGITTLQRVPVIYGDQSRQAAQIVKQNSENVMSTVPIMAVYINSMSYDRERVQDPTLVSKMQIRRRKFDPVTGTYLPEQGDAYTVERLMPVPYKLGLKLDIWTSNTEQKLQIWEQLVAMFNPAMEIQNTDSYIDWSSLSFVLLTDTNWTSRSVPTGGEEPIDIATMTFEIPIWISTSIKLKKMGVIQAIYNRIDELTVPSSKFVVTGDYEGHTGLNLNESSAYQSDTFNVYDLSNFDLRILTPLNYALIATIENNNFVLRIVLAKDIIANDPLNPIELDPNLIVHSWVNVLNQFGTYRAGISQVRIRQSNGIEIIGSITVNPLDSTQLFYQPFVDTLPANTMPPIDAIINPLHVNVDSLLLNPATGTRYMLTHAIGHVDNLQGATGWKGADGFDLIANKYDIVEFNGSHWVVMFDVRSGSNIQYITNLTTSIQYTWTGNQWIKSSEIVAAPGDWSIAI